MTDIRFRLRIFLGLLCVIMILATWGFMAVEGLSLLDSFYYSIVTVATVGYGDIHPMTPLGKILSVALIVTGVGTFLGVVANATEMMLNRRETQARMQKLNMVIGIFFSRVGTRLLARFARMDPAIDTVRQDLIVNAEWSEQSYRKIRHQLAGYSFSVEPDIASLDSLKVLLESEADHMIRLLENPNLLEHEAFTELLRAVFHLTEELMNRTDVGQLPPSDMAHLSGDIRRAYRLLVRQWIDYMRHLKIHFPYLYSLSMRTNPFDESASAVVR
jgi:hypothetical protein